MGLVAAALTAATAQDALAGETAAGALDAKAAFEKLKTLAGRWQGTAGEPAFPAAVTYRLASNGTAVTEVLFPDTPHEMMTVYFLVGNDLVGTHYCTAGNQPRFKLDLAKSTPTELIFAFDGGTNFDPAKDGHIHDGRIAWTGDGGLEASWSFWAGGARKSSNAFHVKRAEVK
jgi:hypothetical protein